MKIGVFDSGIGGQSVADAIKRALPNHEVDFKNDVAHMPYGTKQPNELLRLVSPIVQQLIDEGCQIIVIACNTVSTTIIGQLRDHFTVPLIAMEPMIKPATEQTKSNVIAVCATPSTLASQRYQELKKTYAKGVQVIEPDCSRWASMIEKNEIDEAAIDTTINTVLDGEADVIVLGCTHYHWIEAEIAERTAGKATVLQPEIPVIEEVKRALERLS